MQSQPRATAHVRERGGCGTAEQPSTSRGRGHSRQYSGRASRLRARRRRCCTTGAGRASGNSTSSDGRDDGYHTRHAGCPTRTVDSADRGRATGHNHRDSDRRAGSSATSSHCAWRYPTSRCCSRGTGHHSCDPPRLGLVSHSHTAGRSCSRCYTRTLRSSGPGSNTGSLTCSRPHAVTIGAKGYDG